MGEQHTTVKETTETEQAPRTEPPIHAPDVRTPVALPAEETTKTTEVTTETTTDDEDDDGA